MSKCKYVCKHCRSERIYQNCDAKWDVQKQSWFISDTWNNYYCQECDGEARIDKIEIEGETL
jgi:hypothetical protein